ARQLLDPSDMATACCAHSPPPQVLERRSRQPETPQRADQDCKAQHSTGKRGQELVNRAECVTDALHQCDHFASPNCSVKCANPLAFRNAATLCALVFFRPISKALDVTEALVFFISTASSAFVFSA